jgi:ribosome-binding factor A
LTLHGLESARGFLQSKIAKDLDTRYTPILKFVLEPNWLDRLTETSRSFQEAAKTAIPIDSQDAVRHADAEQLNDETNIEDEEDMADQAVSKPASEIDQDQRTL